MSKKIVISFSGIRGCEIPLLYFGAKHFEDLGFEKVFINPFISENADFQAAFEYTENKLQALNLHEYDEVVFVAKSMGTVIACKWKEKYNISADLILFTPLNATLPYIKEDNDVRLVAAGSKDKYLDAALLAEHCARENIKCYIEPGVGHRMEVMGDLQRNLEILKNVIGRID